MAINAGSTTFYQAKRGIVQDGLLLNLDAGVSQSYDGVGTTWYDLADDNNGTLTNGPTFDRANGGSILLDGSDDFIDLGSQVSNLSTCTVSFWINYVVFAAANVPIGDDALNFDLVIYFEAGNMLFQDSSGGGNTIIIPHNTINAGTWYNFMMTRGSTNVTMYQDGASLGQVAKNNGTFKVEWIGRTFKYDNAKIGAVHVYDRELSSSEVQQNYNAIKGRFQ